MIRSGPVVVINPNSTTEVTDEIEHAVADFADARTSFECLTLRESPATIMSDEDVAQAGDRVAAVIAERSDARAFIIACFSDPGLAAAQHCTPVPVIGIQRAAVLTAMTVGSPFGVIALGPASVVRHMAFYDRLGVRSHLAGEEALSGVSALEAGRSDSVYAETLAAGRALVAQGAKSVLPGCAGFSPRRAVLERDLGIPVIDPVRAAAAMVKGLI